MPRGSEAAPAAFARGQFVDLDELDPGNGQHDELGNPHSRLDDERLPQIGVQQGDLKLAAVARVDEARRIDDRDAMLRREPGAWLDKPGIAVGDRDGKAGCNERTFPGRELDALAGGQVEARVARVGTRGYDGVRAQPPDRQLDQAVSRLDVAESAIRYGAKRGRSRRGRRAITSTPSPVSLRSSIGVPSAYSSDRRSPSA